MKFNAITLDTNIFEGENYNLENGILARLEQFARVPDVKFVISDIVVSEIFAHMQEKTKTSISNYIKALKEGLFYRIDDEVTKEKIKEIKEKDVNDIIKMRINDYEQKTHLITIKSLNIDIQKIIRNYFHKKPPFSEKKKEEFPDAIALQSLENWAIENNKTILAVSKDKDWQHYCENSSVLHCVKTIEDALSLFYKDEEFLKEQLKDIFSNYDQYEKIMTIIEELIMNSSDKLSINIDIDSPYEYEEEYFEANFAFVHFTNIENLEIIDFDKNNNEVTISIPAELTFFIEGEYSFSIKDEDDYIGIGGNRLHDEQEFKTNLIVSLRINEQALEKSLITSVDFKDYSFKAFVSLEPDFSEDYQGDEYIEKEPEDIR